MKIAVWKTGHEIADTVAEALAEGFDAPLFSAYEVNKINTADYDAHIAYGILRGAAEVFKDADRCGVPYFHLDRGYFNPGHYDGYYRISCRGTQASWHEGIPRKPIDIKREPRRTKGDYVLICPPTKAVCDFFGISLKGWEMAATLLCYQACMPGRWRQKGSIVAIEDDLANARAVITFNSSVGWKALQMGVPVLSDINHSIIGSHYQCTDLQSLTDKLQNMPDTRLELFEAMEAHQFTLGEIRQGKAWPLIQHYLSTSAGIAGKPLPPMSAPIPSHEGPKLRFQSNS
jgi:hypothetical protein